MKRIRVDQDELFDELAERYVEGVTGQTGKRLTTIMRLNGLV